MYETGNVNSNVVLCLFSPKQLLLALILIFPYQNEKNYTTALMVIVYYLYHLILIKICTIF